MGRQCSGPYRRNIKCGKAGHMMRDCNAIPNFVLCEHDKREHTEYLPGSRRWLLTNRRWKCNMHRSRTADALLEQITVKKEVDVIIISEQTDHPGSKIKWALLHCECPRTIASRWRSMAPYIYLKQADDELLSHPKPSKSSISSNRSSNISRTFSRK